MRIREVLEKAGATLNGIPHDMSVEDAVTLMLDKKITGLLVTQGEQPVGIFTERDVLRCYVRHGGKPLGEVRLGDAMTNKLIVANAEDDVNAVISMMVQHDIRHLPVIENGRIIGVLPIRDLAHHLMESLTEELSYLQGYVADLQDAAKD